MKATVAILTMVAAIPVFLAAGCGAAQIRTGPAFGEVVGYRAQPTIFQTAAGSVRVTIDGEEQTLLHALDDATLVVFLDKPCGEDNDQILKSSNWIDWDVTIIMVSAPGTCDAHNACVQQYDKPVGRVISLCDSQNILRNLYGVRPEGGVLLLDQDGLVTNSGTLAQFDALRMTSQVVAQRARVDRQQLLRGGGEGRAD
jgi:hypothetical protein